MIDVEVFPVEPGRWIAVIDNAAGAFSTESPLPEDVPHAVERALREVLGDPVPQHRLLDAEGGAWTLAVAAEQLGALGP